MERESTVRPLMTRESALNHVIKEFHCNKIRKFPVLVVFTGGVLSKMWPMEDALTLQVCHVMMMMMYRSNLLPSRVFLNKAHKANDASS